MPVLLSFSFSYQRRKGLTRCDGWWWFRGRRGMSAQRRAACAHCGLFAIFYFYFNWNWRLRSDFENIDVITGSKQGHERVWLLLSHLLCDSKSLQYANKNWYCIKTDHYLSTVLCKYWCMQASLHVTRQCIWKFENIDIWSIKIRSTLECWYFNDSYRRGCKRVLIHFCLNPCSTVKFSILPPFFIPKGKIRRCISVSDA